LATDVILISPKLTDYLHEFMTRQW